MGTISIAEMIEIDAPLATVRAQFGDVAHHERTSPHAKADFTVVSEEPGLCRYTQTARLGPLRLKQHVELVRSDDGPLVNTIVKGPLTGGTITFAFAELAPETTEVTASLAGSAPPLISKFLARNAAGTLRAALIEDKADIESGGYQP